MVFEATSRGARGLINRADQIRRRAYVANSMKWISGSRHIILPHGEVVSILLARNMSHYLDGFYEYHRNLGVKYFIYVDNGSTDNSLDIVSRWSNATVISTQISFRKYQSDIRRHISSHYCTEGWRLAIDPDELFDFVGSEHSSIRDLVRSLSEDGYTGLVAQMLDLVCEGAVEKRKHETFSQAMRSCEFYSVDDIDDFGYFDRYMPFSGLVRNNVISNGEITWKFGGIRRRYFGEYCCITKHPLFFYTRGVKPFVHPHLTTGLKLADFTGLLRHYKFSGNYIDRELEILSNRRVSHDETFKRVSVVHRSQGFAFDVTQLSSGVCPANLLEKGFLVMSERAKRKYA